METIKLMAEGLTVVLAIVSVTALGLLSWWRWSAFGLHRQADRRLLLADVVLIVAAFEILLDAIGDVLGPGSGQGYDVLHALSLICRGAFAAGAFTLVITFPADERRERAIRRIAKIAKERTP